MGDERKNQDHIRTKDHAKNATSPEEASTKSFVYTSTFHTKNRSSLNAISLSSDSKAVSPRK